MRPISKAILSEYFDVDLTESGVFNAVIDKDNSFFINIIRLKKATTPEFQNAYNRLNQFFIDIAKLLDDAEALNALLEANSDSLYCRLGSFELNVLPVSVTPGSAGKIIVKVRRDKMISTDKWFYKTAENFESLPAVVYNTSVDVTTSSSAWHGGIELQDAQAIDTNTWEITPTSGHTAIRIVEVKRNMKPFAVNSKSFAIGE